MILLDAGVLVTIIIIIAVALAILLVFIIVRLTSDNNKYPTKRIEIDVTNKRISDKNDALDYYLINYS